MRAETAAAVAVEVAVTEPTGERQRRVLGPVAAAGALILLLGLQPVTTDLMLAALPALAGDLHASQASVQLTISALILAFGLSQLACGPLSDRFGRRPVLLVGLSLYLLAALGAAFAADVAQVVAWRALQGAAMAAAVVCGRAMVRDLYTPQQGAQVMARALGGLGVIAIVCPPLGGVLVALAGWRASMGAMAVAGAAALAFVVWRLPETAPQLRLDALRLAPLWRQTRAILSHRGFLAWAALVTCSYGGLFVFLAASGIVLIRVLGLSPTAAGLAMSLCSASYIVGTLLARRWIARVGLARAVVRAAGLSATASLLLLGQAWLDLRSVWAVMLPTMVYALGHGIHQPCGQTGAIGPFPRAAGQASALAGSLTAVVAFGIGLWLGQALDGTARPLALGMGWAAALTTLVAWTGVRRYGDYHQA